MAPDSGTVVAWPGFACSLPPLLRLRGRAGGGRARRPFGKPGCLMPSKPLLSRWEAAQDAWSGASEWERGSVFLADLARALGLNATQVDQMVLNADALRG